MIRKLLIANRGEIACRVIRTARRLGIRTVAVYSEADAASRHVALADEAYLIGPAPPRDSYLKIDTVIAAAKKSGADAVHPGYGFLSENAAFAEACAAAGLIFVGPPPAAIRAMGDKSAAKKLMDEAGVPIVPGYHGAAQDLKTLTAAAKKIGYPVLLKASAGGGGKGMRVVTDETGLADAVAGAKREAASAFGDDRLLVERYLLTPRHIEIQVFADGQGNAVYLFERDCSIQRRHQKVLEEAPAPGMTAERRRAMGEAAVQAARAVGYRGAGTVEFIADPDGRFYFMEMNTRLQVEHPVTEMIPGQDLVEWQLIVAAGDALPRRQSELAINGHAFEVRLYAEDPARDFLPATGRLQHLVFPEETPHVRVDTGIAAGDAVSIHYDPMIAKLIVWDRNRGAALARLRDALRRCEIVGLACNLAFLSALAAHPAFAAAELDTGFIGRHLKALVPPPQPVPEQVSALAALALMLQRLNEAALAARQAPDPHSPWHMANGWRLNDDAWHVLRLRDPARGVDSAELALTVHFRTQGFVIDLPSGPLAVRGTLGAGGRLHADLGGTRLEAAVVRRNDELTVVVDGTNHVLQVVNPMAAAESGAVDTGRLTAPMPGKIVAVRVAAGQTVKRGAPLLVLEAMKMEHTITAPADGVVDRVRYAVGDQVDEGAELVGFTAVAGENAV
jgi:3-methylcrotonyl-CoA carboxylase alpha subunit